jgi:hypothetical protein
MEIENPERSSNTAQSHRGGSVSREYTPQLSNLGKERK